MCETTGSFMYRRFKGEVWPSIQESMTKLLDDEERPGGGNLISETYKYQRSILKQYVFTPHSFFSRCGDMCLISSRFSNRNRMLLHS